MMQSTKHTSGQRLSSQSSVNTETQQDQSENIQGQGQGQNVMRDLFVDSNLGSVAKFFMKNQIIINPTEIKQILHTIGKYDTNYQLIIRILDRNKYNQCQVLEMFNSTQFINQQGVCLSQLKEMLITVQTNSTLLAQKNDRGGNMKTKDIFDELIDLVIVHSSCGKDQAKKDFLTLISIMMKYNNISKQNLQNLFGIVSQNFYSGFVDGNLISTSLDILHSIFHYQVPITSEPHTFFYFNGLRSGIEVVNSHWCFQKGVTFCFWVYLQMFEQDPNNKFKQSLIYVQCDKKEFEFYINEQCELYYQSTDKQDKKEPIFIVKLHVMHWQFLTIQIGLKKVHFGSDQYVVNVLHDNEKISGIVIDFPKIKASTVLDKMAFFRNFVGRCQSILIFRGGSPESDNINNYTPLYKNYKFGIETENQLADLCKHIGSLFTKKELFYLPIRSYSKYIYEICYKDYGILGANSGVFCKESNFMPFSHFCGLHNIIPYFYLMKFCTSKKRQEILNSTFSLINILFKNEKFKCQEEAQNLNFFLVISQLMNETGLKLMSKQTIEHIAEIRQNVSCNLKQDMFSKFIWNLNIINVEDAEVFELYYKFVQAIYIDDFYQHSRMFGIPEIVEFLVRQFLFIEKIEPKNQLCCTEHFPNEKTQEIPNLDKNQSSMREELINLKQLSTHGSNLQNKKNKFVNKYDKKLSVLMNLIEKVLYASKGSLAGDIYHLIKCLTLNLTPCFYRNLLRLMINLIEQDDKEKRTILKKFFEYQGIYSVLFTLSRCTSPIVKTLCVKLLGEIARLQYVQQNADILFKDSDPSNYENQLGALISYSLQFTFLADRPLSSMKGCKIYEDFEIIDSIDMYEPQIQIVAQSNHFNAFKKKNTEPIKELEEDNQMSSFEMEKGIGEELSNHKQSSQNLKTVENDETNINEVGSNQSQKNKDDQKMSSEKRQSLSDNKANKLNTKNDEVLGTLSSQIHFHPLYVSIIEWVLNKEASSQLNNLILLEETDQIQSIEAFLLLIQFFDLCDDELQQDIIHNSINRQIFLESKEFQNWVIKILFRSLCEQMQTKQQENSQKNKSFENQWNMAIKILSKSYSHGMTSLPSFSENLNELVGLIKNVTNNMTGYQFQIVNNFLILLIPYENYFVIINRLNMLENCFKENVIDDIKSQGEFSKTHLQKNMKSFINLTFSFIFSESYQIQNPPIEFDFYQENSSHFTYLEEEYLDLPAFPKTFGQCIWIDAPLIFRIMESYSNLFSKYCINNDLLFNFFTIEQSLQMDNLYQILFAKQQTLSLSSHPLRKFSANTNHEGEIFSSIQNGLAQSATFQNKIAPQDEEYPFVQQLFFMMSSLAEFFLKSFCCSEEQLISVFTFLENMVKVSAICVENSRQIQKSEEEVIQIKNFFIFALSFYYNVHRHLQKENNETLPFIEESIRNIMHTLFLIMDKTCKIHGYSKIIIRIFQNDLFDQNNNPLLTEQIIKKYTFDNMNELDKLIFTDEWQYALIDDCKLSFPDSAKIRQQFEFVRNQESYNVQQGFEKVMKQRKKLRTKFDDDKYLLIGLNNSKDQVRKTYFLDKDERIVRQAKHLWYNIWKKNRIYGGLWKHPNFKSQIDVPFNTQIFEYSTMEQPSLFYYKMSKYMTKQKVRPLLKIKIVEPKYVGEFEKKKIDKQIQKRQLHLLSFDIENTQTSSQSQQQSQNTSQKQKKSAGFNLLKQIKNLYQSKNPKEEVEWFVVKCQWIKSLTIRMGVVKVDSQYLSFYFDTIEQKETHLAMVNHSIPDNRPLSKSWSLSMVKYYMRKKFVQRKTAIEFFMYDGQTVLLNFPDRDQEAVIEKLQQIRKKELHSKPNFGLFEKIKVLDKQRQIKKWISRQKSNLDYLMILNFISGRSYRDLTQYPVFPWIWIKYDNKTINLNDASQYRNFSKTMGALGSQERTELFKEKLETTDHFNPVPPYNFGTHYSSPAIIFQFLLRIKPYNTGAWYLQAQRFDIPDRLFFSLFETFKNVTEEMSDVRELIPEFFYLPELFLNLEKHDFGLMQTKERVHNVQLPPWCEQDPYKFVITHRLGLESDIVSRNINQWIDLFFGCKSRGKEAEQNLNKYYYLTYDDEFNIDDVQDEKERIGYESQIIHFGQCPNQLLTTPHPSRIQNQQQGTNPTSSTNNTQSSQSIPTQIFLNITSNIQQLAQQLPSNLNPQSQSVALNQQLFVDKSAQLQFFRSQPKEGKEENHHPDAYKFTHIRARAIISIQFLEQTKLISLRKNGEVSVIKLMPAVDEKYYPFKQNVVSDRQLELDFNKVDKVHHLDYSCQFRVPPSIFLNQGKYLLTGGLWGGKINLFNVETEKLVKEFKQIHNWTVTAMDFDYKTNTLVTGSKAGDVCIIKMSSDYQTFVDFEQFYDHKGEVTSIHINYDFRCVATASIDGTINIYNYFNKKLQRQYNHPKYMPIHKVQITIRPLYAVIFFSERDCTFYSYSINGQLLGAYFEDSQSILNPIVVQDSLLLDQFKLKILELPYLTERQIISKPQDIPNAVWWQPSLDRKYIVCGADDGNCFFVIDPKGLEANVYKALNQFV